LVGADSSSFDIDAFCFLYILFPVEVVKMKRIPIDVKILNFLATQSEPVTINQIDDGIDCYPNIIASYLRGLTDRGLVVSIATGKVKRYSLAK
jgi:DNA-binding IscR family transcriptional regulator